MKKGRGRGGVLMEGEGIRREGKGRRKEERGRGRKNGIMKRILKKEGKVEKLERARLGVNSRERERGGEGRLI